MSKSMKFDEGKAPMTLVDPAFTEGLARVLGFGATKYGVGNWRSTGLGFSRVLDAAHRHLAAFELGQDNDPETGLQHMYHVAACAMFMAHYVNHNREDLDDRHYKTKQGPGAPGVQDLREGAFDGRICPEPDGQMRLDLQDVQQPQPQREASEVDPVAHLQSRIAAWADRVYPHRTTEVAFAKMMGEIGEVLLNPEDPLEWADVVILLVDAAKLRGVDILQAAHEKMAINEKRQWEINPETGLMSHVGGK